MDLHLEVAALRRRIDSLSYMLWAVILGLVLGAVSLRFHWFHDAWWPWLLLIPASLLFDALISRLRE